MIRKWERVAQHSGTGWGKVAQTSKAHSQTWRLSHKRRHHAQPRVGAVVLGEADAAGAGLQRTERAKTRGLWPPVGKEEARQQAAGRQDRQHQRTPQQPEQRAGAEGGKARDRTSSWQGGSTMPLARTRPMYGDPPCVRPRRAGPARTTQYPAPHPHPIPPLTPTKASNRRQVHACRAPKPEAAKATKKAPSMAKDNAKLKEREARQVEASQNMLQRQARTGAHYPLQRGRLLRHQIQGGPRKTENMPAGCGAPRGVVQSPQPSPKPPAGSKRGGGGDGP